MKIRSGNLRKSIAALVTLGLVMVGTYAVRSALHRTSPAVVDAQKSELVVLAAAPPQEASKQAITATPPAVVGGGQYSPYVGKTYPDQVYWGVAHVHTGYSFDAGMFGITLTPDDLFKVARGGEVVLNNGMRFKQDRPLDWVAITDHAEYMGIADEIRTGSPDLLANPLGKKWYDMYKTSPEEGTKAGIEAVLSMTTGKPVFDASKLTGTAWAHATAAAEKWNQPGVFTTLHGFEWTSMPAATTFIAPSSSAITRTA